MSIQQKSLSFFNWIWICSAQNETVLPRLDRLSEIAERECESLKMVWVGRFSFHLHPRPSSSAATPRDPLTKAPPQRFQRAELFGYMIFLTQFFLLQFSFLCFISDRILVISRRKIETRRVWVGYNFSFFHFSVNVRKPSVRAVRSVWLWKITIFNDDGEIFLREIPSAALIKRVKQFWQFSMWMWTQFNRAQKKIQFKDSAGEEQRHIKIKKIVNC